MRIRLLVVAALASTGLATAQDAQKLQPVQLQEIQLPEQVINPAGKQPQLNLDGVTKSAQARAAGCIKHQVYNVQGLNRISTTFVVATSSGDKTFNFEGNAIRYIPDGDPLPLASTLETNRWDRILTTLERAGAANKPLLVDYNTGTREVFGIFVQWSGNCMP
ncbi:MAG: hypothetical protein AAF331_12705 [Pseudomonadota bacterium]